MSGIGEILDNYEDEISTLRKRVVSVAYVDEVPTFEQGESSFELAEDVTAEDCKRWVGEIVKLRQRVKDDRVIDDEGVTRSCINPLEDLKNAIKFLKQCVKELETINKSRNETLFDRANHIKKLETQLEIEKHKTSSIIVLEEFEEIKKDRDLYRQQAESAQAAVEAMKELTICLNNYRAGQLIDYLFIKCVDNICSDFQQAAKEAGK